MITQRTIRRTLLALALVALGANGTALAEWGFADTFEMAQPFPSDDGVTAQVTGSINNNEGVDFDYYYFEAIAGQGISLQIAPQQGSELDPVLNVFDPQGTLRHTVKNTGLFTVPAGTNGPWRVSVASDLFGPAGFASGPYDLSVTRSTKPETPEYLPISIDIKPNNPNEVTTIKPGERHIRVALLSDRKKDFDPFAIHVDSLRFGATGSEESLIRCAKRGKDLNGDRKPDRVCRFYIAKTGLTLAKSTGLVKGTTTGGKAFQGGADVRMIQQKHHKDRKHHDDDDDDDD